MSLSARRCAKSLVFMSSPSFARVRDPLHFREHLRPRARPHETRSFPLRPDQTIPRTLAFPHPAAFDQLPHLGLILFALFPYGLVPRYEWFNDGFDYCGLRWAQIS